MGEYLHQDNTIASTLILASPNDAEKAVRQIRFRDRFQELFVLGVDRARSTVFT